MKAELEFKDGVFEYPCLAISDTGLVVLFSDYDKGTSLMDDGEYRFGEYRDTWDTERFEPLDGTIKLTND